MDLPSALKTDSRIGIAAYADDIKIYAAYDVEEKQEVIENLKLSVERMLDWAAKWRIKVNVSKSQILRLGNAAVEIDYGIPLRAHQYVRDLGVILDTSFRFSSHVETIASNATRVMFSLLRNVHTSDASILLKLYKAYVLPILEYCSPVWNPCLKKDILKLEKVQKTFTRILFYRSYPNKNYPQALPNYETRMQRLGLKSLFFRRIQADIIMGFKILRGEVSLKSSKFWTFRPSSARRFTINLYYHRFGNSDRHVYQNSFACRVARLLNKLPPAILSSENSSVFRRRLLDVDLLEILGCEDVFS
ncbi:hypothetical protein Y032_1083g3572 [Ancylostoma ceylanicum]|nr:hypothetical protein Y032_1083g3572 [Ancylostoma ceylanicum]